MEVRLLPVPPDPVDEVRRLKLKLSALLHDCVGQAPSQETVALAAVAIRRHGYTQVADVIGQLQPQYQDYDYATTYSYADALFIALADATARQRDLDWYSSAGVAALRFLRFLDIRTEKVRTAESRAKSIGVFFRVRNPQRRVQRMIDRIMWMGGTYEE